MKNNYRYRKRLGLPEEKRSHPDFNSVSLEKHTKDQSVKRSSHS